MADRVAEAGARYGGRWTSEKLDILETYLNSVGDVEDERDPGVDALLDIYKNKLAVLFGARFLRQSRTLRNSTNAPLFEFLFCVGSRSGKAIGTAQRIARHILENL